MKHLLIRLLDNLRNIYYNCKCFIAGLFTKVNDDYLIFDSFNGTAFNDNPQALFLHYHNSTKKMVWVFKNSELGKKVKTDYPEIIIVKSLSFKHFYYLKKSKYWIFNYKTPPYFKKHDQTIFLQTWHGIPLKRLGCDIKDNGQTFYRSQQSYEQMTTSYRNEGIKCNFFITPSNYAKKMLKSAFDLSDDKLLMIGYPRNEKLYQKQNDQAYCLKLKEKLNLTKKVILYAPTWRDQSSNLIGGYKSERSFLLNFDLMFELLGDEYQIIYKPHYLIKEKLDLNNYQDFIIDASTSNNLDELMLVSDLLITDYSSIYFDYSILNKPIYFIMLDLINYQDNLRGFYIDIETDLPNDYYTDEKTLYHDIKFKQINNLKYDKFKENNQNYRLDYSLIDKIISN